MQTSRITRLLAVALASAGSLHGVATAAPPAASPYGTDVPSIYVQDATSDAMANLNMVLCIMNGMAPGGMLTSKGVLNGTTGVTEAQYIALVDKNKCDTRNRDNASNSTAGASGSTSTPNYMTALVDVKRGSGSTDPMVADVWMSFINNVNNTNVNTSVFVKLSASSDPATSPPYGVLRVDYVGYPTGSNPATVPVMFNGYIDANGPIVNYLETGTGSSNVALGLNAQSTSAGNGTVQAQDQSGPTPVTLTYKIAYNAGDFARNSGGADMCFDRSKANAQESVWSYGTYDATGGAHVDQANPGFPISGTAGTISGVTSGATMYGYASYWGINFGGMDQSVFASAPDGQLTMVTNITDQRPNNTTAYKLYKNGGKLTMWSQNPTTLAAIDGIPFSYFGEGCKLVNGGNGTGSNVSPSGSPNASCTSTAMDFQNWVMQWNNTLSTFQLVGLMSCSPNSPCVTKAFTPVTVVQGFKHMPIDGYSDALGGNITIPLPTGNGPATGSAAHAGGDTAYYYVQSTVLPGATVPPLYCLSNCPTVTSLANFAGASAQSPFAAPTDTQFGTTVPAGSSPTPAEVSYTYGSGGLSDGSGIVEATTLPAGQFQSGVMSGRLFRTDLVNVVSGSTNSCPNAMGFNSPAAYCEPPSPPVYYTYQTGPNQWDQTTWLTTTNGSPVAFDAPVNINYTVPSDAAFVNQYGAAWAGKPIQLQFNGFGNLQGIPGNCVDGQTNQPVDCAATSGQVRYVPAFAIPDGTALTIGTQTVLTRALNAELRLKQIACPSGLSTASVTTGLPTAQPHNPALSTDAYYIGTAPTLTGNPAVIDGVLQ